MGSGAPVSSPGGVPGEPEMHVVADFLSDQWIVELANACADARDAGAADRGGADRDATVDRFVIEPTVRDVPERGVVRYRVSFDGSGCAVEAVGADALAAHVRLETDYATAVALSRGEMNAQAALAEGRLRVLGDVARLTAHAGALARFDDLFAAIRATTSYPGA